MKNRKHMIFPILYFLVPLIVLILYKTLPNSTVRYTWYVMILYIGLFSGIYALYKLKDMYQKSKFKKCELAIIILSILFFLACIVSTIFSETPIISLIGTAYRREGLFTYISYLFIAFDCMLLNKKEKKFIYQIFIVVASILSIFTIFKIKGFLSPYQQSYNGIFFQFNHFSYFLILALVCNTCLFIISNKKIEKILYYISYVLLLTQLILNNTFGGYLAILVTTIFILIYYVFVKKIKISSIIILLTFILLSCFVKNGNGINIVYKNFSENIEQVTSADFNDEQLLYKLGTARGMLWINAIHMIEKRPLIGYGIEGLSEEYARIGMWYVDKPHDIVIALSGYVGIPGMLCFFGAIGILMLVILLQIKTLSDEDVIAFFACICFLGSSIVANSMFYTTPYAFMFFGILFMVVFKTHFKQLTNEEKVLK